MHLLNRPPKVEEPPASISYRGSNVPLDLYKDRCIPRALGYVITIIVISFDLVTDWLSWGALSNIKFKESVVDVSENMASNQTFWSMDGLFENMPFIYLGFCVVASMCYALEICRLIYSLTQEHKKMKETLDGVPYQRCAVGSYAGDVILLMSVCLEDLPLSLLLLAIQAAVSCTFLVPLGSSVFQLSTIAALANVMWKAGQVFWRCTHYRCAGTHEKPASACHQILRICALLSLAATLCSASLNLVLLVSPNGGNGNWLFDKISIDQWIKQDSLIVSVERIPGGTLITTPTSTNHMIEPNNGTNEIRMQYITKYFNYGISNHRTLVYPCEHFSLPLKPFMQPGDQDYCNDNPRHECHVLFKFEFHNARNMVVYDMKYRIVSENGSCTEQSFKEMINIDELDTNESTSYYDVTTVDVRGSSPIISDPESDMSNTSSRPTLVRLTMTATVRSSRDWIKCRLSLVHKPLFTTVCDNIHDILAEE